MDQLEAAILRCDTLPLNITIKLAGSIWGASDPASTLCGHLLWRFAIQQQSTVPQSGHALLTQVGSMYS